LIFAPAPDATGNPAAAFSFMAADAFYNSTSAPVSVNVSLPTVPQTGDPFWSAGGGNFIVNFSGTSNATYSVWASSNLLNWARVGSAAEVTSGRYEFADTTTNFPQRFYRAGAP
jgi:hypothetical protein